jgi:sugar lactone lactonase YvrE
VDTAGNVYVADTENGVIRKITPAGVVTTRNGTTGTTAVPFSHPRGLVVDGSGNIYVANTNDATIQKVAPDGTVTTLAGTSGSTGHVDATGSAALFNLPQGIVLDSAGNLFVSDPGSSTIRKVTPAGVVTTVAGTAGTSGSADGTGVAALFSNPYGMAIDSADNLYVADNGNAVIRKITPAGVVTTLAGSKGVLGSADGTGTAAQFNQPTDVAADAAGNVYVADTGNELIRKITPAGVVTTLGGAPGIVGSADATGSNASFNGPAGVAADAAGNIFVADSLNNTIRSGVPAAPGTGGTGAPANPNVGGTSAGNVALINTGSAGGTTAFLYPTGVAVDSSGTAYVTDASYNTVQKITPTGLTSRLAGSPGFAGMHDGAGIIALFNQPGGNAIDSTGNLFVADTGNATIRKIAPDGTVSTLAGAPASRGNQDGTGASASFSAPSGVAVDGAGNVYVADAFGQVIRKITSAGVVTTLAGSPGARGEADGTGGAARFNHPTSVAVDSAGTVYVADAYNDTIRKVTAAGVVTTLAGSAGISGGNDGTGRNALFNQPMGVAVDAAGNVFVSDTANATIRRVTPAGVVTTVAGMVGISGLADGAAASALFNQPRGLVVDASGNLLVADTGNAVIRKITAAGVVSTVGVAASGDTAPAITTQPISVTVRVGASVVFTAAASGSPTPTYQWRKNGNIITGATSTTYTVTSVATGDAALYTFTATNVAGSATSQAAVLSVDLTSSTGSATGGGSIEAGFVGILLLLGAARWMRRKS